MTRFSRGKFLLVAILMVLVLGVVFTLVGFMPNSDSGKQSIVVLDDAFTLTPQETFRQGLGSFHGDENVTLQITAPADSAVTFSLLTFTGLAYSAASASNVTYTFMAKADYYEAAFYANATAASVPVHLQVYAEEPIVTYPFSWLSTSGKVLFLAGWAALMLFILKPMIMNLPRFSEQKPQPLRLIGQKNLRRLRIAVIGSLVFWFVLLALNNYPTATFESWYTDAARNPYSAVMFTKTGFQVFNTPLGTLSSADASPYKFVTWAEMPNLYPIGSIFLFLPFGALLESGVAQALVFKMEIALFLVVAHLCLYFFLKRFWREELEWTPKNFFGKPFWRQEFSFLLKAFATYLFYVLLILYAANGQFDSVAFLFCLVAAALFLADRDDLFLLVAVVASTFKYQAGIFLLPLILVSLMRLIQKNPFSALLKNKALLAAMGLAALDLFTAFLSAPFLLAVRSELVMNSVDAFSQGAQISWSVQAFAVLLTLAVTLAAAIYLLRHNRLSSLFVVFTLLPIFTMPYFQPWYLPFLFVYPLIPQSKRSLSVMLLWLVFIAFVLSFGGLSFNPVAIADNFRRVLHL